MKYLTEPEEKKLLRTARETKGKKAERDYMILFLGFNTGLRLKEIISLNVADVRNREKLFVRPETTKRTRKQRSGVSGLVSTEPRSPIPDPRPPKVAIGRTIPLNKKMKVALRHFMKLKLQWREGIQDEAPLFISKKGGRISRRALQSLFEEWCIKAGIIAPRTLGSSDPRPRSAYTVHSMRHSFAKRLLQRGIELPTVQATLGHASLASTGVYTEAGYEEMEAAVNAL